MLRYGLIGVFLMISSFGYSEIYKNSVRLSQLVHTIRDPKTEAPEFRGSLEEIGQYLAAEVLQILPTEKTSVTTCLGCQAVHEINREQPVIITILRAGLPLFMGVHKVFPTSEAGFVAMSRNEHTLVAKTEYIGIPEVKDKTVIVVDTMIATAGSMLDTVKLVKSQGPKKMIIIGAIASRPGLEAISNYDSTIPVFVAAIDEALNSKGYIVPGLGDAGDRSFGKKAQIK